MFERVEVAHHVGGQDLRVVRVERPVGLVLRRVEDEGGATALAQRAEVVDGRQALREERVGLEGAVGRGRLDGRRPGQRKDVEGVGVLAAPEADPAQDLAGHRDVLGVLGQRGGAGLDADAVVAAEPGQRRVVGTQLGVLVVTRGDAEVGGGEAKSASRPVGDHVGVGGGVVGVERVAVGRVEAGHGQAVEGRLEHRLLVDAGERVEARQVVLLGEGEGPADRDGLRGLVGLGQVGSGRPLVQPAREVEVEPLAVLQKSVSPYW